MIAGSDTSRDYVEYVEKHWLELIERYDPWILWGDIGYPPGYKIPELFAYFYNRKPDGVVNDRWTQLPRFMFSRIGRFILSKFIKNVEMGSRTTVPHCDFITPEYAAFDHIIDHKWETCRGIGNSFGYNQIEDDSDYKNADELIRLLADIVSKNGNLLLNVGPCADGSLHPAQVTALEGIGNWLKTNGEAIYGTRSWVRFRDDCGSGGEIRYTTKDGNLYIIVIRLPDDRTLSLPLENIGEVILLGTREVLEYKQNGGSLVITLPEQSKEDFIPVLRITGIL